MNDVPMTTATEPDGAPRIAVLDILRGVAILGILFMNINDMGQSLFASFDDVRHLGWSASDQVAWWLREVFANGTARCMLEMLFGAGMVILTGRAAEAAGHLQVLGRYYVRNLILLGFGLVHIFILLWPGDILHTYGIAALIAFLFARLPGRWLVVIGLNLAAFTLVSGASDYQRIAQRQATLAQVAVKQRERLPLDAADRAAIAAQKTHEATKAKRDRELAARVAAEDVARSGTALTWARAQWNTIGVIEGYGLEALFVWEAASTMLVGAGLFKLGLLQGGRSRRFYVGMAVIGYAIGVTLRCVTVWQAMRFDDAPKLDWATSELARLAVTLGHIALINLLATSARGARLLRPFVAAGRTALTLYIAQTLICLWLLFPPFALALYGKLTWGPLMVTAFAIDAALLWAANRYVRHFDIAPVEWAWRSLIEGRRLPWRKPAPLRAGRAPR
ncbi:DUF418 domain-containing protein [Sphingomonas sp. NFR15]|uniref:DUF418 domain-containing protein n=1 Tax=Sphingomonas sp. NFR15 TaxID=1566282 RepID=UPI0008815F4F|nr:DUF418 domain-containing protein [Sphingomonas sp. NFR15]SDA29821.1 uncharacterized protein SAMN03159340_02431 [Sphingomonas sp. NFR15]